MDTARTWCPTTENFKTILHKWANLESVKQLPDPRLHQEALEGTTSTISLDHILNQELEVSTSLSELNYMLRQTEANETAPTLNHTERDETTAWTVLNSIGTTTMDKI